MTREEIIRIKNLGASNEWPKVWNRQLDALCDVALDVMGDTPRMDAFILQRSWAEEQFPDVQELIDHARQLERELAAERKRAEAEKRDHDQTIEALTVANQRAEQAEAAHLSWKAAAHDLEARLAAAQAELTRLSEEYADPDRGELARKLSAAQRDAERYRWLRDIGDDTWLAISKRSGGTAKEIDEAIDAALAQQEKT